MSIQGKLVKFLYQIVSERVHHQLADLRQQTAQHLLSEHGADDLVLLQLLINLFLEPSTPGLVLAQHISILD